MLYVYIANDQRSDVMDIIALYTSHQWISRYWTASIWPPEQVAYNAARSGETTHE